MLFFADKPNIALAQNPISTNNSLPSADLVKKQDVAGSSLVSNPSMYNPEILSNIMLLMESQGAATTNPAPAGTNMLVFTGEKRGPKILFEDECLPRGLTNAMSLQEIQRWATNAIEREKKIEAEKNDKKGRHDYLNDADVPEVIRTMNQRIPSVEVPFPIMTNWYLVWRPDPSPPKVGFVRSPTDEIVAVRIGWDLDAFEVGAKSFEAKVEPPVIPRKLADGIYMTVTVGPP